MIIELTPVNARLISMNIYLGEKQEKMISMLPEKAEDEKQHGRRHVGRFLGELEPCSIGDLQELNKAYTLVSVYRKKYPNKPPMKGFYWVVRVVLCLNEFLVSEEVSKDISENKETYWKSVSTLWQSFLFRTRAHINPFFDGEEDPIKGFGTVSLDFDRRTPCKNSDGTPVMVWPGEKGEGNKVPLEGKYTLSVDPVHRILNVR